MIATLSSMTEAKEEGDVWCENLKQEEDEGGRIVRL